MLLFVLSQKEITLQPNTIALLMKSVSRLSSPLYDESREFGPQVVTAAACFSKNILKIYF